MAAGLVIEKQQRKQNQGYCEDAHKYLLSLIFKIM
jgi:hypothetical protein